MRRERWSVRRVGRRTLRRPHALQLSVRAPQRQCWDRFSWGRGAWVLLNLFGQGRGDSQQSFVFGFGFEDGNVGGPETDDLFAEVERSPWFPYLIEGGVEVPERVVLKDAVERLRDLGPGAELLGFLELGDGGAVGVLGV